MNEFVKTRLKVKDYRKTILTIVGEKVMNKCIIELTKEELLVIIEGLDYQIYAGSAIFGEYNINIDDLSNKLEKMFCSLDWSGQG